MPNATCDGSWDAVADPDPPARRTGNVKPPYLVTKGYRRAEATAERPSGSLTTSHGAELVSTLIDRGRRSEPRFRVTSLNRSEKQQLLTLTSTHSLPN